MDKLSKLRALVTRIRAGAAECAALGQPEAATAYQTDADELQSVLDELEPDAEPVAWMRPGGITCISHEAKTRECAPSSVWREYTDLYSIALYTAPPDLESLRAENARLVARLAEREADAERWRWARQHFRIFSLDMGGQHSYAANAPFGRIRGPSIDAAVDAARSQT